MCSMYTNVLCRSNESQSLRQSSHACIKQLVSYFLKHETSNVVNKKTSDIFCGILLIVMKLVRVFSVIIT